MSMIRSTRMRVVAAISSAAIAAAVVVSGLVSSGEAEGATASIPTIRTTSAISFRNDMRKLWEEHVTWTRLVIVSVDASLPDLTANVHRLLRNQVQIGNAVKPFFGERAGDHLTDLLKRNIKLAAKILVDVKEGKTAAFKKAKKAWYRNARLIARFLHSANPRNWPLPALRRMMRKHLDLTLREASDYLGGKYAASVQDFDRVQAEILRMADMLSIGIIKQFPAMFR
jgi:hypothetical protein